MMIVVLSVAASVAPATPTSTYRRGPRNGRHAIASRLPTPASVSAVAALNWLRTAHRTSGRASSGATRSHELEQLIVGPRRRPEAHQRGREDDEQHVHQRCRQLGQPARGDAGGTVDVRQVTNGLKALNGDDDAAQHEQHRTGGGLRYGREVNPGAHQPGDVVSRERRADRDHEQQHRAQRHALEQFQARQPANKSHGRDQHDHANPDKALCLPRARRRVLDHELGEDPDVERYRDDVRDDDHEIRRALDPRRGQVQPPRLGERLDDGDVVADRSADHPRDRAYGGHPDRGHRAQRPLEDRHDDEKPRPEDRRQRRDRRQDNGPPRTHYRQRTPSPAATSGRW